MNHLKIYMIVLIAYAEYSTCLAYKVLIPSRNVRFSSKSPDINSLYPMEKDFHFSAGGKI